MCSGMPCPALPACTRTGAQRAFAQTTHTGCSPSLSCASLYVVPAPLLRWGGLLASVVKPSSLLPCALRRESLWSYSDIADLPLISATEQSVLLTLPFSREGDDTASVYVVPDVPSPGEYAKHRPEPRRAAAALLASVGAAWLVYSNALYSAQTTLSLYLASGLGGCSTAGL